MATIKELEMQLEVQRAIVLDIERDPTATDEDIARGEEALDEFVRLQKEIARAGIRSAAAGYRTESGDVRSPELLVRGGDPWADAREMHPLEGGEAIRSRAMRAVEAVKGDLVQDSGRERVMEVIERNDAGRDAAAQWALATSDPAYESAFRAVLRDPIHGHRMWNAEELAAYKRAEVVRTAMSLTDANGGYLVPFTLDPTIIVTNAGIAGSIRSISTVKTTATDSWNGVTSAGINAEWLGEGAEAADATPAFDNLVITPKKAAAWVYGTYEVLGDSNFATQLGGLIADAKLRLEEAAFATANTGATRPRGVVAAVAAVTASIVTSAAINAYAVGDVYRTYDSIQPRGSEQISWIANRRIYTLTRQFDTAGGSAFWSNLGMGVPNQLLGQPAYENSTMTGAVSTSASVLLAGNFSEYYIVDRLGTQVLYNPMVMSSGNNRPDGTAGWFAFWRVGADVADPGQFRLLRLHTTATAVPLA